MGIFQTTVNATGGALLDHLSQVDNVPDCFARTTSTEPGDGEEVHTTAQLPDGQQAAEGDAWFRMDEQARRIDWASDGANDDHGSLGVTGTAATIKRLVEQQNVVG
jgi:hypothetical protein